MTLLEYYDTLNRIANRPLKGYATKSVKAEQDVIFELVSNEAEKIQTLSSLLESKIELPLDFISKMEIGEGWIDCLAGFIVLAKIRAFYTQQFYDAYKEIFGK